MSIIPTTINECEPITLFQLGVQCVGINPSSYNATDGQLSLLITGGTPPYTVYWSNGNISNSISDLGVGTYSATIVDYYGDFTATTTCTLVSPKDCDFGVLISTGATTPTPTPTPTITPTITPTPQPSFPISQTPTPTPTPTSGGCQSYCFCTAESFPQGISAMKVVYIDCEGNTQMIFPSTYAIGPNQCACFSTNIFPPYLAISAIWANDPQTPITFGVDWNIQTSDVCCIL